MKPPGRTFGAPEGQLREMRDLPAPKTKTRIALRSIRATLAPYELFPSLMVRSVAQRRVSNHASFETPTCGRLLRMRRAGDRFARSGHFRPGRSVARMERSEMRDLPAPEMKTRIALRSIRATLAARLPWTSAPEHSRMFRTPLRRRDDTTHDQRTRPSGSGATAWLESYRQCCRAAPRLGRTGSRLQPGPSRHWRSRRKCRAPRRPLRRCRPSSPKR